MFQSSPGSGMILKGREKAGFDIKSSSSFTNPVLAGIMTSASNALYRFHEFVM